MTENTRKPTQVVTGEVRLSYVRLLEPYASNLDKPDDKKYSVCLLIPKADKVTIKKIKAAQQAALTAGKAKFNGKIPTNWTNTLRDGDDDDNIDTREHPEYSDHLFINVSATRKPGIVDRQRNPIDDPNRVYSGVYARVSMNAFAFNTQGNKGVSFGLNNVQIIRDGDRLDGSTSAESDFDDDEYDDYEGDDIL